MSENEQPEPDTRTPEQRFNSIYKMLNYDHEAELHGKEWLDQHINEMIAGTKHKVLSHE